MDIDSDVEMELRYRAKAALRKRARALRNAIPREAALARSARIAERIEGRNEVDLTALGDRLRARGVRVAYPSIDPETRVMTFRFVADPAAMEERGLGFCEPAPEAEEATSLDVVVVPALQIDGRGHHIGYGAGFYDRTLPRFAPPARSVGVAFDFQLVAEVPETPGDVTVSLIVSDGQILEPDPAG